MTDKAEAAGTSRGLDRRTMLASTALAMAAAATPSWATGPSGTLSPQAQREDLAIARRILEESHVGLNWWLGPQRFAAMFDAMEEKAATPTEPRLFLLRLTRLVAALRHGHTTLEASVTGTGFRLRRVPAGSAAFPLCVRVIDGRLYVSHDLSGEGQIGPGAEILAIDGQPAPALLADMERLVSADGANPSSRQYQIGPGWRFADLMQLMHGTRERFRVRVRQRGGRTKFITLPAATPEEMIRRFAERRFRPLDTYPPAVAYERRDRVGVLTVGSFYEGLLPQGSPGFAAEFDRAFDRIADDGIDRLVLDLRGNEGGNDEYVPMLYAHLADRPFRRTGPTIVRSNTLSGLRYAEAPSDELRAFAEKPDMFVAADATYGWVLKPEFAPIIDFAPAPRSYTGPLAVLTDGGSFSATGGLLDLLHRFHRREGRNVQFLGKAPGIDTTSGWGSGGQTLAITLPNSRLRLAMPVIGSRNHFGTAPSPVSLPDRMLVPSAASLASEVDEVLTQALA